MQQDCPEPGRASLGLKLVGNVQGRFVVARYQRGYRWGPIEVECLLRDIYENGAKPYSLQPIVVQARDSGDWELVDGQQRLTTLYLIFQYLQRSGLKPSVTPSYQLEYETRPKSAEYLMTLDPARRGENIDFHHLYRAYECIDAWFQKFEANQRQLVADDIFSALMRHVHLIWYQAPGDLDATILFTRLNVGRIPLNDAELFKALLLSRAARMESSADRPTEIAAQWDGIERDLRHPDVWAFISTEPGSARPTRITLLLEVLSGARVDAMSGSFPVFDSLRERTLKSPQAVWDEVVDLHGLVMGWFESRDLYHKIGYLIAVNHSLTELVHLARGMTKRQFDSHLDARIRQTLNLSPSEAADLSYESNSDMAKAHRLLLLMNVETIRRNVRSSERYPFRSHKAATWSLEHIHAQNAQTLNTVEQWREWLMLHQRAIEAISPADPARQAVRQQLLEQLKRLPEEIDGNAFNHMAAQVLQFFSSNEERTGTVADPVHSISNLALLPSSANSALSNSAFEVKRQKILELDRAGEYIPICTKQVFLKYFTGADAQQIHFWSPQDREGYLHHMIGAPDSGSEGVVFRYLRPEEHA